MNPTIRPARPDDADAVAAFTSDTWPEHGGDYVPRVLPAWIEGDGQRARTLVAAVDGRAIGLLRTVVLSPDEAWCGGLRVDPEHRGEGVALRLTDAGFSWARERGASVARAMVFSWNAAGLGVARAAGFEPVTEFRWAHPAPEPGEAGGGPRRQADVDPGTAWTYWQCSETRDHLRGLALDPAEPWALSWLARQRLVRAAIEDRLLVVRGGGDDSRAVDGFAVRVRVSERPADDEPADGEAHDGDGGVGDAERWAEYGVADWTDRESAARLLDAVARDAASVEADRTRVLIPETVRAVSDAAAAGVEVADHPNFVLAADLTDRSV